MRAAMSTTDVGVYLDSGVAEAALAAVGIVQMADDDGQGLADGASISWAMRSPRAGSQKSFCRG